MGPFPPLVTNIPLLFQGKTRDTHEARTVDGVEHLLVVATNRISTHEIVHKSLIPYKGEVLTALTIFWLTEVLGPAGIPHHLVAYGTKIYDYLPGERADYPDNLHHHAIIVRKLSVYRIEFIFRRYLAGSLYEKFYSKGIPNPYGIDLPAGLPKMHRFKNPLFTPTEKGEDSDPPLNTCRVVLMRQEAHQLALQGYEVVYDYLHKLGIEVIDSKFEVGIDEEGRHYLADEIATPDSSRFARTEDIREDEYPPWLDKQIARDIAEKEWAGNGSKWTLTFPPLAVHSLSTRYCDTFRDIVGMDLRQFQEERLD